jgi:hypothetical protein
LLAVFLKVLLHVLLVLYVELLVELKVVVVLHLAHHLVVVVFVFEIVSGLRVLIGLEIFVVYLLLLKFLEKAVHLGLAKKVAVMNDVQFVVS